jgi:hypothetical protein
MILSVVVLVCVLAGVMSLSARPLDAAKLVGQAMAVMIFVELIPVGARWMLMPAEHFAGIVDSGVFQIGGCCLALFSFGYVIGRGNSKTVSLLQQVLSVIAVGLGLPFAFASYLFQSTPGGDAGLGLVIVLPLVFSGTLFPIIGLAVGRSTMQKRKEGRIRHAN